MMPYRGKRPEIGWSLHMSGGWRTQWERVQRWYERLSTAASSIDRHDFLYAFFESALHLRDWLKDTGAVSDDALKLLFAKTEMRLCRDLANSHKHLSISTPSQPRPPSEAFEYAPEGGNLTRDASLVILSDGSKHDAFELAARITQSWRTFLAEHIPDPSLSDFRK